MDITRRAVAQASRERRPDPLEGGSFRSVTFLPLSGVERLNKLALRRSF